MTRVEAVAYLAAVLDDVLSDAGVNATDTTGGLKEPLDDALLAMGYATEDLAIAEPTDARWFRLMAEYHTLRRVLVKLALRFRLSTGGNALSLEQVHAHVKDRLNEVAAALTVEYGGVAPAADALVSIYPSFLAPSADDWAGVV
jgi:hypothetical protein